MVGKSKGCGGCIRRFIRDIMIRYVVNTVAVLFIIVIYRVASGQSSQKYVMFHITARDDGGVDDNMMYCELSIRDQQS